MDNFDNYNQGNPQNPGPRINPYTGEPMYNQGANQGANQGYNQTPNQGYNQGSNQGYNQGYNQAPNQGYNQSPNQGYNQDFSHAPERGYNPNRNQFSNQGQRNPYTGDPFQARANLSGRNYPQNNYQQNYGQPRYNSYGNNKKASGCGCALAIVLFMFIFIIASSVGVFFYLKGHLQEFEEYTSNYGTTTQSTTQDDTQSTDDTSDEKIYTDLDESDCHGLSRDDPATTMEEVVDTFVYLIKSGITDEVTIYIDGLTTDDLITINTYPDIAQYAISDKHSTTLIGDSGTVTYYFKINDSFYVEQYYLEGKEIPIDNTHAQRLQSAVEEFNNNYITPGMSDYEKELAIHDYIVNNTSYGNKTVVIEDEHEAYGALVDHSAVCEGYAKAFDLLCTVNDIECLYVTGDANESHGWNMVNLNGIWYHVDTTWDDPVDFNENGERTFENYLSHAYFNVSDEVLEQDGHTWEKSAYPSATSMAMNYYYVNGTLLSDYDSFASTLSSNAYSGNTVELAVLDYDESTYDIVSIISTTSFYGSYQWAYSRDLDVEGYQVITISFD